MAYAVVLAIAIVLIALPYTLPMLKVGKRLYCRMGWHGPRKNVSFDGCSVHARCDWCGYEGMIDSQGNLF